MLHPVTRSHHFPEDQQVVGNKVMSPCRSQVLPTNFIKLSAKKSIFLIPVEPLYQKLLENKTRDITWQ